MTEKIGAHVLDMVIEVLTEHEKKIDALVERFEKALEICERYYDATKRHSNRQGSAGLG